MVEFFINVFNIIIYQPLFNALVFLYEYLPGQDFGVAIIVLTVLIKLVFYPLGKRAIKAQKNLSSLQPKIQEIQKKYKEDKEKQVKAMLELYKQEKINPFSGLLPLLVQLPILVALYRIFWRGLGTEQMVHLYTFMPRLEHIDTTFLGITDLALPNLGLALLAGITQFVQTKMMVPVSVKPSSNNPSQKERPGLSQTMQKQMTYFFPFLTFFILWKLPAAIGLYWVITALFTIVQQKLALKPPKT